MLAVRVLGELEVELDGRGLDLPGRQSGRLLLSYLALRPGMHARADLAALLWPEVLESSARTSLRAAIAAVRRALGPNADEYLIAAGTAVGLSEDPAAVAVDYRRFEALLAEGRPADALELCRGPLLQGLDADWVRQARAEHLERLSDVLGKLAERAENDGSLDDAIRYTRRQVALSPLAEPANRELIRRLAAAGDRASALSVYYDLAERFRRELKTVPSRLTREIAEQARSGMGAAAGPRLPLPAGLTAQLAEPFVNRHAELRLLRAIVEQARSRSLQAAIVTGEPGIGKTTMLARLAAAAQPATTVLFGRCRHPASSPFEPFVEALRHYVAHTPAEQLQYLPQSEELAALVPALSDYLPAAPAPAELIPDGQRTARAIVDTFACLARQRPVVLLVDDLHDADRGSFAVLGGLLACPEDTPLLAVLSFRETEVGRSPLLQRLSSRVRALPGGTELRLDGLDEESVALLARALDREDSANEELLQLHARTGGNPFFLNHLLRSADRLVDPALPPRIHDVVRQEIDQLSADAQACLTVASVAGDDFGLQTITRVIGLREDRVLDALDEAVLAQVVVELPIGVGRYQFRHALLRESIYGRLTATRRAHLHRRLADVLAARQAEDSEENVISIVAHLRGARDLVASAELAGYVLKAAGESERHGDFAQAARFYTEYIELLGSASPEQRARTLIQLGDAARRAGELDRARSAYIKAHVLAGELDDESLELEAVLGLSSLPFVPGDRPVDPEMIAMLERGLELPAAGEPPVRAPLLARLAQEAFYDPQRPRPDALAEEAVAVAELSADPRALAAALTIGHLAFRGAEGPDQCLRLAGSLASSARRVSDSELLVLALLHETTIRGQIGELSALEANARKVSELAAELHQPAYAWWAHLWRATKAIASGRFADGATLAQRAHELGHVVFGPPARLELRAQQAWIAFEQERFDELEAALEDVQGPFAALPVWRSLEARILAGAGAEDVAARSIAALTAGGLAALERDTNWLISATFLAETAAQTGDAHTARELFVRLKPRAEQWAISARGTVCLGPVAAPLALLALILGEYEQAEKLHAMAREKSLTAGALPAARRLERLYGAHAGSGHVGS